MTNHHSGPARRIRRSAAVLAATALLVSGCGDDSSAPSGEAPDTGGGEPSDGAAERGNDDTGDTGQPDDQASRTACELFPEDEAETVIGADLELIPASDEYRCSYVGVSDIMVGAVLSFTPGTSKVEDLQVLRDAYGVDTIEEIEGLGDAGFYHEADPIYDAQFIKNGVWVTVAVAGLVGSDDFRAATLQIAQAAADRL